MADSNGTSGGERWDEKVHDAEDLYIEASMRWGGDSQMAVAAEEFSELAAVCAREVNGKAGGEELLEELVDARIMIEQIAQHITDKALQETINDKLYQLDCRLHGAPGT